MSIACMAAYPARKGKMKKVYSSGPLFLLLGCAIIVETACAGRGGPLIELRR